MKKRRDGLDRYDVAILSALSDNTRLSAVELAGKVHLSRTAVSRRIAALKRMRVLNDAGDILNYELMGFKVRATVEIATSGRAASAIKPGLLERPEVLSVAVVAGDGVLSLDVIAFDLRHLHHFVSSIRDNGETTTKILFAEEKSRLSLAERLHRLKNRPSGSLVRN